MNSEKKLYRSQKQLISGVCSGLAEYFNIDPIVVQILTVILTLVTGGLLLIPYIILWVILPIAHRSDEPVEVQPQEAYSDAASAQPFATAASYAAATPTAAAAPAATVTPAATATPAATMPAAAAMPPVPALVPMPPPAFDPNMPPYYVAPPYYGAASPEKQGKGAAGGAFWFGLVLLFIGVTALVGIFVPGLSWWRFWPLILVIAGIAQMVVPGGGGYSMPRFVGGLILFSIGVSALLMTLNVVSSFSLWNILRNLWPMLVIMCGFFVLGGALKMPLLTLAAGLTFVVFCLVGLWWFSTPGPTDVFSFFLPGGNSLRLDIPWR
ncbi:MAG: PspC domain-containing protein [Coriobacteriaceae bacterium]|nr:PspC domain-containing protein [Coriobacteriaceae bacterium]